MAVYLDHNATTPVLPEVLEAMRPFLCELFANPSSIHGAGVAVENSLEEARRTVARILGVDDAEIVFTSGGTEANNLAVLGTARALARRGRHVLVSAAEHEAVFEPARALEDEGFSVDVVPLDGRGIVDLDRLAGLVRPDTVLVACILASNETGAIQPVDRIAAIVRERSAIASLHVDAVQAIGKIPVEPRVLGCRTLCATAHKIGGPKGAGFLYVKKGSPIRPITFGGGQERGLRPGTQDVASIVGLARALSIASGRRAELVGRWTELRALLAAGLERAFAGHAPPERAMRINTPLAESVATTLSVTFPGSRGEVLVRALEEQGIICSTGPACHERTGKRGSRMLAAMGLTPEEQEGTVRISLGPSTTVRDVEAAISGFAKAFEKLSWTVEDRKRSVRRRIP